MKSGEATEPLPLARILRKDLKQIEAYLSKPEETASYPPFSLGFQKNTLRDLSQNFIVEGRPWQAFKILIWAIIKETALGADSPELKEELISLTQGTLLSETNDASSSRGKRGRGRGRGGKNSRGKKSATSPKTTLNEAYSFPGLGQKNKVLQDLQSMLLPDTKHLFLSEERTSDPLAYFHSARKAFNLYLNDEESSAWKVLAKHQEAFLFITHTPFDTLPTNEGGLEAILLWAEKIGQTVPPKRDDPRYLAPPINKTPHDEKVIAYYTILTAKAGNPDAQNDLGNMYANGVGVDPDPEKAFYYVRLAADQDHVDALYNMGVIYADGVGVKQDYDKAVEYFTQAADRGSVEAKCYLGLLYVKGFGVARDYQKAVEYLTEAAEQDHAEALYNLSSMYADGVGVDKDPEKAFDCLKKAADQSFAKAQYNVGVIYAKGIGVKQDYDKAFEYFQLAAARGVALAHLNLGVMYAKGFGVPQNYELALVWYQLALAGSQAEDNRILKAEICLQLAYFYHYGLGTEGDEKKACEYIEKVATLTPEISETRAYKSLYKDIFEKEDSFEQESQESRDSDDNPSSETEHDSINQDEGNAFLPVHHDEDAPMDVVVPEDTIQGVSPLKKKQNKRQARLEKQEQKRLKEQAAFERKRDSLVQQGDLCLWDTDDYDPLEIMLQFASPEVENDFNTSTYLKRINVLISFIKKCPWGVTGGGKPEYLKQSGGLISRRIDREHRLVYRCIGTTPEGTYLIEIVSCTGHYDD